MIIRHIQTQKNINDKTRKGAQYVETEKFISDRLLLAPDQMGYSVNLTTLKAGTASEMQYLNHWETCYCIEGYGTITDLATGEKHELAPGVLYALDKHDKHHVYTKDGMKMLCVFRPALKGNETHQADGSYAANEE